MCASCVPFAGDPVPSVDDAICGRMLLQGDFDCVVVRRNIDPQVERVIREMSPSVTERRVDMCREFTKLYERARAVEELRRKAKPGSEPRKSEPAPAKPTPSKERGKVSDPVPV